MQPYDGECEDLADADALACFWFLLVIGPVLRIVSYTIPKSDFGQKSGERVGVY